VRSVLALFGIGTLVAAGAGSLFALMLLDYFARLPASLRLVLLLAWIASMGTLAWRLLIAPLSTRLTDQFLASRVENVNKSLSDELMSAVHFLHAGTHRTNALAARHIDRTAQKVANVRFEEAVDFRQAGKALGIAGLILVIIATVAALNPRLATIALSRWFTPNGMPWPHTTHVNFDWSDYGGAPPKVLPLGEKITLRAKVDKGSLPRVWLYHETDRSKSTYGLMTYQKDRSTPSEFIFESALEPDPASRRLSIRVEAGDDDEEPWIDIRLAPRPVITEFAATITPPAYVKNPADASKPAPAVVVDLLAQPARAVEGAVVSLRIKASKPFQTDASGVPVLSLFDQNKDEEIPLGGSSQATRRLLEPNVAEVTFTAARSLQARLLMKDADGFENRLGGTLGLEVVPDAMPTVIITDPRRSVERAPNGFVDLAVQATDDLGLDGLKLRAEKFDAKPGEAPLFEAPIDWASRTVDPAVGSTTGKANFHWDLTPLNLQPGARVTFYAMVQDNYDVSGKRHDWVKSPALSLQIRSTADIAESARKNLNEIKDRINNLKGQQEQTRSFTEGIRKAVEASGTTSPQQKSQLADLAQQEAQETSAANAIQQRAEQVAEDLRQNKMGEGELGKLAQDVSAGMATVGQQNMPKAAADLNRAQESAGNRNTNPEQSKQQAKDAANAMASANSQQDQAIATMDNLIGRLGSASDFEALRSRINGIASAQQALTQETRQLAPQTIGKKPSELSQDLRNKLDAISRQQKDLANQTAEAIEQMQKTSQALSQTDQASSQSLQRAADAGNQANVSNAQSTASNDVSQNQMSNASNNQGQAQRGLQQMLDELNKNDRRQLEQLARQLRALLEEVKKLKADEEAIQKDTLAAGDKAAAAALEKLGDRQGTLQQNTIVVQKKAENTQRAKEAAPDLRDAADAMAGAAGALYSAKQPDALEPEKKALTALDAAIKKLEESTKRTEAEAKDKDLAQYIKDYEAIQKDQQAVKDSTDKIEARRQAAADKQVDRMGGIELGRLATTQGGLAERINALSADEKLKEFTVVVWMNGQVVELMGTSKDRLAKTQLGPQVVSAQQGAIDRIGMIIDALKEEKARNEEFQRPNSGGGGGGGGGKPPLVPPLAQLKLLKSMQTVVNAQTTTANKSLTAAPDDAAKNEARTAVEKLGKQQGEIKDITDKLLKDLMR
jgi:hypothetical protein